MVRFLARSRAVMPVVVAGVLLAIGVRAAPTSEAAGPAAAADELEARARALLEEAPLIDGHNDTPWQWRRRFENKLDAWDFADTLGTDPPMHTDLARLEAGGVGGQFWSVYVPVRYQGPEAVQAVVEQIDLVHRMADRYEALEVALTAADVTRIHAEGHVASLIGIEGGHCINNSLPVLRQLYYLGARYMTLTHSSSTGWADSATDEARVGGLSPFGEEVVREMNRLGMLVDLAHVSADAMRDALAVSEAPVIFSHSGAWEVAKHPRNVPDDVLEEVAENGGVVMVVFLPDYVSEALRVRNAARDAYRDERYLNTMGDEAQVAADMKAWEEEHPAPRATLAQVADHIDHIREVAGVDHIGLGGDFDGMYDTPEGLEDVSAYPALLGELLRRGYSEEDVKKIAGLNVLRVMAEAEQVAARLRSARPASEATP